MPDETLPAPDITAETEPNSVTSLQRARSDYLLARKKHNDAFRLLEGARTSLNKAATAYYRIAGIDELPSHPKHHTSGKGRPFKNLPLSWKGRVKNQLLPLVTLICIMAIGIMLEHLVLFIL